METCVSKDFVYVKYHIIKRLPRGNLAVLSKCMETRQVTLINFTVHDIVYKLDYIYTGSVK